MSLQFIVFYHGIAVSKVGPASFEPYITVKASEDICNAEKYDMRRLMRNRTSDPCVLKG
jgi:hypothetical protein